MRSLVELFASLWTVAYQTLSKGFSRQKYWSGLPFPPLGNLPHPRMEPRLLHLLQWQMDSLPIGPPGEPEKKHFHLENIQKFRRDILWRSSPLFLQLCCCWEPKLGATGVTFTLNHLSLLHLPHPCFKEHPATDPFSSDDLSKDSLRSPLMTRVTHHCPFSRFHTHPSRHFLGTISCRPCCPESTPSFETQCTWKVQLPLWCQAVTIFKGVQYLTE